MHFFSFTNRGKHRKIHDFLKNFGKIPLLRNVLRYNVIEKEECKMANVFDVAKYILQQTGRISTMKLQKLCYYAQAWSLAWTEEPLFCERIEAWVNGPVCPDLFQEHKGKFKISFEELAIGDVNNLTFDQKDTIDRVLDHYGDWDPYELREQTHSEDPWRNARKGIQDGVPCTNEITRASMGEYYGNL